MSAKWDEWQGSSGLEARLGGLLVRSVGGWWHVFHESFPRESACLKARDLESAKREAVQLVRERVQKMLDELPSDVTTTCDRWIGPGGVPYPPGANGSKCPQPRGHDGKCGHGF